MLRFHRLERRAKRGEGGGRGGQPTPYLGQREREGGDDQRRGQADAQRDAPERVCRRSESHLPTATFRSARAEWRMRTPESLMREMPASASVWPRTRSTPSTACAACFEIRLARTTIVMTIAAATAITTMPSPSRTHQPVDAPIAVANWSSFAQFGYPS